MQWDFDQLFAMKSIVTDKPRGEGRVRAYLPARDDVEAPSQACEDSSSLACNKQQEQLQKNSCDYHYR